MKVALLITEKVFQRWPDEYCAELTQKLLDRGHRVFYIDEDKYGPEANQRTVEGCDAFVGSPLNPYYALAGDAGLKRVGLLGATLKGDGIQSPIVCKGCLDKEEGRIDCFFSDEVCMSEITPNDVVEVLCK